MQAGLKEFRRILLNNLQGRCREQKNTDYRLFPVKHEKNTHTRNFIALSSQTDDKGFAM